MALTKVAGHFTAKFSVSASAPSYVTIGSTREGFDIDITFHEQEVHDDAYGDGVADTVQQGSDCNVSGILIDAITVATANVLWANQVGAQGQSNNHVGLLGSQTYGSLQLTPVIGTPAEAAIGAGMSYFFYLASCINNYKLLLGSKLREIPVTFRSLPDPSHSNLLYAIATTV